MRTFQYKEPLASYGIDLTIVPLFGDDYIGALYGRTGRVAAVLGAFAKRLKAMRGAHKFDAIWVEKEVLPWLPAFVELSLLPSCLPLILDYDDAVFHRYDRHRSAVVRAILGAKLDRVMARADLIVAGNSYLADRARKAGARRVEIVPTVIDLRRYPALPRNISDYITVGWIGSPSTAPYLNIVKPTIERLAQEIPLQALAIGARADQVSDSIFKAVNWTEDTEVGALQGIDIGLMPLADTDWEKGKCAYKLIQYMALGIPVVASPIGANQEIVRHGVNGYLADNEQSWHRALSLLASNPEKRARFGQSGHSLVETSYTLAVQTPRLAGMILEIRQAS